jgi:hypothetical protein
MIFMKKENRRKFDSIVFAFLLQRYLCAHHPGLFAQFMLCVDSGTCHVVICFFDFKKWGPVSTPTFSRLLLTPLQTLN